MIRMTVFCRLGIRSGGGVYQVERMANSWAKSPCRPRPLFNFVDTDEDLYPCENLQKLEHHDAGASSSTSRSEYTVVVVLIMRFRISHFRALKHRSFSCLRLTRSVGWLVGARPENGY